MAEAMIMVLRVDLECHKCYRKIKKLLCKVPEIREQAYYEEEDKVIIKVVCCSPESIRQKLICKSGKTIKSIEIRIPEKPKSPTKPDKPIKEEEPKPQAPKNPKPAEENKPKVTDQKPKSPVPTPAKTPVTGYPIGVCRKQCFDGLWGGPCHCHHGYGIPYQQPPSSYDGYVRLTPSYDGWPSGCRCDRSYGCRCEFYTENYPPCIIM